MSTGDVTLFGELDDVERIKYIPMSVIEDIRAEIELQKKGFPPSSDYYKAIARAVNIIDKYIKGKEQEDTYNYLLHGAESLVKENPEAIEALQDLQKGESE